MDKTKSMAAIAGLGLGSLGVVACLAGVFLVWLATERVRQISDRVCKSASDTLVHVHEPTSNVRQRVEAAAITTADIERMLLDWSKQEVGQRIALQTSTLERSDQLAATLQQASDWLEITESSVSVVRDLLSSMSSTNGRVDTASLEQLLSAIASARELMSQAEGTAASIRGRIDALAEEGSREQRAKDAIELVLRLTATLGSIDSRLENFENRLTTTETQLESLQENTTWWLRASAISATLLLAWMAVGQMAVCRMAWSALHHA